MIKKYFKFRLNVNLKLLWLAKSFLALSTLLTLLTTDGEDLFRPFGRYVEHSYDLDIFKKLNLFLFFQSHESFFIHKSIAISILTLVVINIFPKTISVLHWWVSFSFATSVHFIDGGDQINSVICLFLIPLTFIAHGKSRKNWYICNFGFFTFLFFKLQFSMIYFHSLIGKLSVNEWSTGTAIYNWFSNPIFGVSDFILPLFTRIFQNIVLTNILNWSPMLILGILSFSLVASFNNSNLLYRNFVFFIGVAFHFLNFIFFGLSSFFLTMVGGLVLYLLPVYSYGE